MSPYFGEETALVIERRSHIRAGKGGGGCWDEVGTGVGELG
jgi:hypothetical protein